jgi:hypothetical protein
MSSFPSTKNMFPLKLQCRQMHYSSISSNFDEAIILNFLLILYVVILAHPMHFERSVDVCHLEASDNDHWFEHCMSKSRLMIEAKKKNNVRKIFFLSVS